VSSRSLRCHPASNSDFIAAAADCLAELAEAADAEIEGELEERLRPRYPKVAVHRMEVIAKEWTPDEVWYVSRDGRLRLPISTDR
jgi:hypothetical protein